MFQSSISESDTALDNSVWCALTGTDLRLSEGGEKARRYTPDVSPFAAVRDEHDPGAWAELAELAAGGPVTIVTSSVPDGWTEVRAIPVVQMVFAGPPDERLPVAHDFRPLTHTDVPDMLALVAETRPGPFAPGTIELGGYRGWHVDGSLVCMAGERMHPDDWTEISGVCTAPGQQGRGLAGSVVSSLVNDLRSHGRRPFLNVAVDNVGARRLYEKLGFSERARQTTRVLRPSAGGLLPR
jgi:ribosomal protein S18 acetylase RimI-like enzyme